MTLSTASIVELRERNTTQIESLTEALSSASLPRRGRLRDMSRRLDRLFNERVVLENASTSLAQRTSLGLGRWNQQFIRLKDIRQIKGCPLSAEELRHEAWKALPSGKFKRFQETFSDPHNFVVPRFTYERGKISFFGRPDISKLSVAGCIVSADRIPDEFATALKLVSFTEQERRSPMLRYLRKTDVEIINRLKLLWDAAELRSSRDFRVLVVQKPAPELAAQHNTSWDFPRGLHGTILFTTADFSERIQRDAPPLGPKRVNPLRVQHFITSYEAYRRTLHASSSYRTERDQLASQASRGKMALGRLGAEYTQEAPPEVKESIQHQVKETLRDGVELLADATNQMKGRARTLMQVVSDFRDSRGRINPNVVGSRIAHANRSLEQRQSEIQAKHGHNQRDEDLLGKILVEEFTILDSVARSLTSNIPKFMARPRGERFARMEREIPEVIMSALVPDRGSLSAVSTRPFSTFAGLLRLGCRELESCLSQKDYPGARTAAVKMHVVTKLFLVNESIQRMSEHLVTPRSNVVPELRQELAAARLALARVVLPSVRLASYDEALKGLSAKLGSLHDILYAGAKKHGGDLNSFHASIKERLDGIVPEEIAWGFVPQPKRD